MRQLMCVAFIVVIIVCVQQFRAQEKKEYRPRVYCTPVETYKSHPLSGSGPGRPVELTDD